VFAAALWAIDTLFAHASVGVARWNMHMGPTNAYTAIAYPDMTTTDLPQVRPLFYGMWAFVLGTAGPDARLVQAQVDTSDPLLKAYVTADTMGTVRVTVIHKGVNAAVPAQACIQLPATSSRQGQLLWLHAPSPHSRDGVTLAGQTFDGSTDGRPMGTKVTQLITRATSEACFSFEIPPGSAVILVVPLS
jgi:hypothetical protein